MGVYCLIGNLEYLLTLEWFDLSENCITDRSTTALAETLLTALPRLFSLDLSGNHIGNLGAAALSASLPALPRLSRLNLANNMVGCHGCPLLTTW